MPWSKGEMIEQIDEIRIPPVASNKKLPAPDGMNDSSAFVVADNGVMPVKRQFFYAFLL